MYVYVIMDVYEIIRKRLCEKDGQHTTWFVKEIQQLCVRLCVSQCIGVATLQKDLGLCTPNENINMYCFQ